jgi:hypothetical protein
MIRSLMLASLVFSCIPAIAQDLPPKMQGGFKTDLPNDGVVFFDW